ncbi:hypothetical protein Y032_0108g3 [Ancylostoma ceylanicum]|uniref:Lipase_GDSL domain-containing protein n=1 Tax=Ancylostoma ceylanicum TaxID=53326 RepID=A0A016TEA6_9BILA|nr:hypothetical protein Y032_0108g3 [Ancylostoma ceylanicum]
MLLRAVFLLTLSAWQCNAVLPDIGAPNYTCAGYLMRPSKTVPTNVNSVRPADIKLVMALGDSLTAANGAGAEDAVAVFLQYRGLAFQAGGDGTLDNHITIPNILKKYNPKLFGYSVGIGSPNVWEISYLNVAVPGAIAADLPGQARTLVSLLHNHPEAVNYNEDWKLLNIFIGGNDMCSFCKDRTLQPSECVQHIQDAIQIIYDNVPRVIVSVTAMLQLEILRQSDKGRPWCKDLHKTECPCESDAKDFNNTYLANACIDYANRELDLAASGKFDKNDFTVVTQPFFRDISTPPMKDGQVNREFFAPDCFHFSQWGHALVSSWLWKNILEPVGAKTTKGSADEPSLPLACPDPACPFIRTNANSKDCSEYLTPTAGN